MKLVDKNEFMEKSEEALGKIYDNLADVKSIGIDELKPSESALIIVDMINGFAREGALRSPRVEAIIEPAAALMKACAVRGIEVIAFADRHSDASPEFESYPPHCIKGTSEAELVEELAHGDFIFIPKNSTNGFLEEEFRKWLGAHGEISNFIVVGDCTDICITQFALSLKAYFNIKDKKVRIIVPLEAVDTYDLAEHYGELMNLMTLQIMKWNGIEIVKAVEA